MKLKDQKDSELQIAKTLYEEANKKPSTGNEEEKLPGGCKSSRATQSY